MIGLGSILESIPAGVFTVMGAVSGFAFLAGPLALVTVGPRRWAAGLQHFHAQLPAATLLSLLSVTAASVTGTASLVHVFFGIAATGHGGAGMVAEAGVVAAQPLFYGLLTLAACVLGIAGLALLPAGSERGEPVMEQAPMSLSLAVALSALLGLAIVGIDGLLRLHHELMNVTITLIDPAKRVDAVTAGIGGSASAAITERNSSLLILGGGLFSVVLLLAGRATWRVSRARRPHRLLVWASTVALVIVVVGAAWHARLVSESLTSYREVTGRAAGITLSPRS